MSYRFFFTLLVTMLANPCTLNVFICWFFQKFGIPYTVICDNMAAVLMAQGKIQRVFLGADRIALNGDFANKIGIFLEVADTTDLGEGEGRGGKAREKGTGEETEKARSTQFGLTF